VEIKSTSEERTREERVPWERNRRCPVPLDWRLRNLQIFLASFSRSFMLCGSRARGVVLLAQVEGELFWSVIWPVSGVDRDRVEERRRSQ